jgi:hypothetical protein
VVSDVLKNCNAFSFQVSASSGRMNGLLYLESEHATVYSFEMLGTMCLMTAPHYKRRESSSCPCHVTSYRLRNSVYSFSVTAETDVISFSAISGAETLLFAEY